MSLVRWDPFRDVGALQDRINRIFDDAFPRSRTLDDDMSLCNWRPAVDIYETPVAIILNAELPGVKKEDINISFNNGMLTLEAESREEKTEEKEGRIIRQERHYGKFSRSFDLGTDMQESDITAKFEDGVLTITAPRAEKLAPQTKRIEIH